MVTPRRHVNRDLDIVLVLDFDFDQEPLWLQVEDQVEV
jgi:hypothetical protein